MLVCNLSTNVLEADDGYSINADTIVSFDINNDIINTEDPLLRCICCCNNPDTTHEVLWIDNRNIIRNAQLLHWNQAFNEIFKVIIVLNE